MNSIWENRIIFFHEVELTNLLCPRNGLQGRIYHLLDYLAGMTDYYVMLEYKRIFGETFNVT